MKIDCAIQVVDPSGLKYFLGAITPAQIMQVTFVPCVVAVNQDILNVRTAEGYQREGEKKRMEEIAKFYSANLSSLIPPVLLSTRGKWKFTPHSKNAPYGSIEAEDCAAVIDGQHRLGGLSILSQDSAAHEDALKRSIPFMAIEFPDTQHEASEFEVINGRQKGIKPSHLKYIKRDENFAGSAATMLKEDEDSVFFSRIAIADRKDADLITFGAATELVALTFDSYFCNNTKFRPDSNEESKAKALAFVQTFWRLVASSFGGMWADIHLLPAPGEKKSAQHPGRSKFQYRLLEETGLRAIAMLGSKILYKAWMPATQDIAWASVELYLNKVANDRQVNLVLQKLNDNNRVEILSIDPKFQMQGKAGAMPLALILQGALDKD